jgi:hypothetical protein
MPEVEPDKNLEPHRQCEIRRPSPAAVLVLNGQTIAKPAGYYFDVVWIRSDLATKGARLTDDDGRVWVIAETFGSKPMPRGRVQLRKAGGG